MNSNTLDIILFSGLFSLLAVSTVETNAQGFPAVDFGSDGSYGPLTITADTTLDLPPDGIIHATTVNISGGSGTHLRFRQNALNTPVTILATGDVFIGGFIEIDGGEEARRIAGPGGFNGGRNGGGAITPEEGHGPGGTSGDAQELETYASPLLIPLVGGSGGAGSDIGEGGGGGGAILIASNTRIVFGGSGKVTTDGSSGISGSGRGRDGGVRLLAPEVVFTANNFGQPMVSSRICRIDAFDTTQVINGEISSEIYTQGTNMMVEPNPKPRLDLVEVAGDSIALDSGPVLIQPPSNSNPNTTVKVRAENFGRVVPISVILQPESGARISIDDTIDNSSGGSVEKTINVTIPVNTPTRVYVWTRSNS